MYLQIISLSDLARLGVRAYAHKVFDDSRGSLGVLFEGRLLNGSETDLSLKISTSTANVGRGLHWQTPNAPQTKFISVLSGVIFDFLFDPEKPGVVYGFRLKAEDRVTLTIPPQYAHGFITTTDTTFIYLCDGRYDAASELTFNLLTDAAGILGLPEITLSEKDGQSPRLQIDR
jgi:dTDP-4-dehydrorhamnose 3,5-epimerase